MLPLRGLLPSPRRAGCCTASSATTTRALLSHVGRAAAATLPCMHRVLQDWGVGACGGA
jgi:hypothetical protein